ncbi:MAG: rod shape-determining protein MreD [Ruminococcaceae bacterium]|nr:rod shape-determining protein MreD [Oscillospiraceae bacterium]
MQKTTVKYNIIKILAFTLIFFLNQTLANKIELFNVAPNLIFVTVLCASLTENDSANIYYALAYGLLFDFFNSKILFIHGIMFLLIAFVLSEIYHSFFENMTMVKGLFAITGCFAYSFLFAVFFGLRGADFLRILANISIVEFIYNSLFSILGIFLYKKILNIRPTAWRVR